MARIEGPKKRGLVVRIAHAMIRRTFGKVPMPWQIKAHHPRLFMANAKMEQAFLKSHRVSDKIKLLAQIRTSTLLGCPS